MNTNAYTWPRFVAALACVSMATPVARSQTRSSASYEVLCESGDCAGARLGSRDYVVDGSMGGIGGLSTAAAPATQAKQGYAAQLYDLVGLSVSATPASVAENANRQLEASVLCDDATTLELAGSEVGWSVLSGPLDSVSSSGLATAGIVYEDAGAVVRGTHLGFVDDFVLTVHNIGEDDYGSYAADGIDDDWQVFYFGEENPDAGPGENPDRDPDDNMLEFLTGFDPTDPQQWFQLRINGRSGTTAELELNKAIPGRTYAVLSGTDLQDFSETVTAFSVGSEETFRVVEDPNASGTRKFYKVKIERSDD